MILDRIAGAARRRVEEKKLTVALAREIRKQNRLYGRLSQEEGK